MRWCWLVCVPRFDRGALLCSLYSDGSFVRIGVLLRRYTARAAALHPVLSRYETTAKNRVGHERELEQAALAASSKLVIDAEIGDGVKKLDRIDAPVVGERKTAQDVQLVGARVELDIQTAGIIVMPASEEALGCTPNTEAADAWVRPVLVQDGSQVPAAKPCVGIRRVRGAESHQDTHSDSPLRRTQPRPHGFQFISFATSRTWSGFRDS